MTDTPDDPRDSRVARTPDRARACPACGSTDLIPILYGYPGMDMVEADRAGEIVIGGCMARETNRRCRACRTDSAEQPLPAPLTVWDRYPTDNEIAAWMHGAANDGEETP